MNENNQQAAAATSTEPARTPLDVLRQACKILAEREADRMADTITSRPGWVRSRTGALVKDHAEEAQRVLAEWPDTAPDKLARYLLGERNAVGDSVFLPGTGWIKRAS